jgi:methylglutaconyl-CoA hydratase
MTDILTDIDARGVATVTLNRPDRHNAFDDSVIASLTLALETMAANTSVRIIILASAGRSFSAGADLEWMRRMAGYSPAENLTDAHALARLMQTLDALPKPTIALVHGAAFGGGVGLVACCDIVIASDRAVFCLSEVKLGLTPATISPYVVRAMGARHARRYFQTAEIFNAAHAQAIGLVDEVVPQEGLAEASERIVTALLQGAPGAQADAKALVSLCETSSIDAALLAETAQRIADRRASTEGREGVAAFLEKRQPSWRASHEAPGLL